MEWNDLPDSEIARQLKGKKLTHPTNDTFDRLTWESALDALTSPTERDIDLILAALHYGKEIAGLRENAIPLAVEGFSRIWLIRLLAAFANQQFLTLRNNTRSALKSMKAGGVLDMNRAQQMLVEGAAGQKMSPDDLITYLVDSLPHWLFHIWQIADGVPNAGAADPIQFAARASQIVSIEHSLRQLWLNALWVGTRLHKDGSDLIDTPRDRALAERWFVWDQRQMMLLMTEHHIDAGASIISGGKLPPVVPAITRTVIRMERPPSGVRKFVTGRASGTKREQRDHVSERDMLERLYTGLFLDETLPKSPGASLTCRELSAAWWVLKDLARLAADDLGSPWIADDSAVARFALTVEATDLIAAFTDCLGIDVDRARGIVDWFTCNPSDTTRLFAKSFWSEPLLPEPGSGRSHILLAPLLVGSPVKRIEAWMERGGISDSNGIKGKGKPYERHVRSELSKALSENPLLDDAFVAEHGLKRKKGSEEIDLLVRIGNAVIVGEIKCFVAPSEPLEKHNHLDNLAKATAQAETKRIWAEANRGLIAAAVGIEDRVRTAALIIHPLVVLNHGFGMGLERNGVPIVDLHYLKLLLGSGDFQGDTRFERGIGMIFRSVDLYKSQTDLEKNIRTLLKEPPVMKRYKGTIGWRRLPFRTSNGRPFFIELPARTENPEPNGLRDMPRHKLGSAD